MMFVQLSSTSPRRISVAFVLFVLAAAVAAQEQVCNNELHLAVSTDRPATGAAAGTPDAGLRYTAAAMPLFKLGHLASMVSLSNNTLVAYFVDFSHGTSNAKLSALSSHDEGSCWTLLPVTLVGSSTPSAGSLIALAATTEGTAGSTTNFVRLYFSTSTSSSEVYSAVTSSASGHLQFTMEAGTRFSASANLTSSSSSTVDGIHIVPAPAAIAAGSTASAITMLAEVRSSSGRVVIQVNSNDGGLTFPTIESVITNWPSQLGRPGFLPNPGGLDRIRMVAPLALPGAAGKLFSWTLPVNATAAAHAAGNPSGFLVSEMLATRSIDAGAALTYHQPQRGARLERATFVLLTNGSYMMMATYSDDNKRSSTAHPCSASITFDVTPQATLYGPRCSATISDADKSKAIVTPSEAFMTPMVQMILVAAGGALCLVVLIVVAVIVSKECKVKASDRIAEEVARENERRLKAGGATQEEIDQAKIVNSPGGSALPQWGKGAAGGDPNLVSPGTQCLHTDQYKEWKNSMGPTEKGDVTPGSPAENGQSIGRSSATAGHDEVELLEVDDDEAGVTSSMGGSMSRNSQQKFAGPGGSVNKNTAPYRPAGEVTPREASNNNNNNNNESPRGSRDIMSDGDSLGSGGTPSHTTTGTGSFRKSAW